MAESIPFDGFNRRYVTPMHEGDVINSVPDMFGYTNDIVTYTRWKLTPEELAEIAATGEVWLVSRNGKGSMRPTWVGSARSILLQCLSQGRIWNRKLPQIEDKRNAA
jgi:hypothetical protein